jgi:hypothetical protein
MDTESLRHLATCPNCSIHDCYARNPVVCVMCATLLNNDIGYKGYFMCNTTTKLFPDLVDYRKSMHVGHIPVCQDCMEMMITPELLTSPEEEFRTAVDEFKKRICR